MRLNKLVFSLLLLLTLALVGNTPAQEKIPGGQKPASRRDPFMPLVTNDGRLIKIQEDFGQAGLMLEGIIYDEQGVSYAIVNSEVVKVGDKIGEYQVLKIENSKVTFIKDGSVYSAEIKKEEE